MAPAQGEHGQVLAIKPHHFACLSGLVMAHYNNKEPQKARLDGGSAAIPNGHSPPSIGGPCIPALAPAPARARAPAPALPRSGVRLGDGAALARRRGKPPSGCARSVCMLFISTVDQPIERVTIQVLDCPVTGSCTCPGRSGVGRVVGGRAHTSGAAIFHAPLYTHSCCPHTTNRAA
jgi:hypothetical protein